VYRVPLWIGHASLEITLKVPLIPLIRKRHLLPLEIELEKYLFLEELEALQNLELDIPADQTPVNTGEVFEEIKDIIAGLQQLGLVI